MSLIDEMLKDTETTNDSETTKDVNNKETNTENNPTKNENDGLNFSEQFLKRYPKKA